VSSDERVWVLPDSLRTTFAARYGPVFGGREAEGRIRALEQFASCGDRVTADAVRLGRLPLVGIVDLKTRRSEPVDAASFTPIAARRRIKVRNPAGMLTERLRTAVKSLIEAGGGLIEVEGEEDLGALALVESMPAGATVIYGIPGAGVSFVTVDAVSKEHVRRLVAQMELRTIDLGA
jgi:uncharacterized protein (UPF0218 family)